MTKLYRSPHTGRLGSRQYWKEWYINILDGSDDAEWGDYRRQKAHSYTLPSDWFDRVVRVLHLEEVVS